MSIRLFRSVSTAIVLGVPPLAAQQTIVVQGGGQAFAQAVAAASHGDTLIVRPGTYDPTLIQKGITVLCDPGVTIQNGAVGFAVSFVPTGTSFVMRGGSIQDFAAWAPSFAVFNCAGSVRFEGVTLPGVQDRVSRCADLALHACILGSIGLHRSLVSFADCTVTSTFPIPVDAPLTIDGGEVAFHGGSIRGGDQVPQAPTFPPTPAVDITDGRLTLAGDAGTVIASGRGALPAPVVRVGRLASMSWNPAVTLVPNAGAPAIERLGTVSRSPVPSVAVRGLGSGQQMLVDLHAQAGSRTFAFASWPFRPQSTPFGLLWVDPASPVLLGGTVPATGHLVGSLVVPPLPPGVPVMVQPLSLTVTGLLVFGAPTSLVLN